MSVIIIIIIINIMVEITISYIFLSIFFQYAEEDVIVMETNYSLLKVS